LSITKKTYTSVISVSEGNLEESTRVRVFSARGDEGTVLALCEFVVDMTGEVKDCEIPEGLTDDNNGDDEANNDDADTDDASGVDDVSAEADAEESKGEEEVVDEDIEDPEDIVDVACCDALRRANFSRFSSIIRRMRSLSEEELILTENNVYAFSLFLRILSLLHQ